MSFDAPCHTGLRTVPTLRRTARLLRLEDRTTPSVVFEAEPNNTVATANVVTMATGDVLTTDPADWTVVQGSISPNSDRDFIRFTLSQPAGVFFNIDSRDVGMSASLDSVIDVFDGTGFNLVGANDDGYDFALFAPPATPASSATSPDSALYLELAAGTYNVRVTSFGGATFGAYQLRLLADVGVSASAPSFSSLPGAPVDLFLDADGHSGNDEWGNYAAAPFDLNGIPGSFTAGERLALSNIWRIVAEDFAPFNVNVTTAEPAQPPSNGAGYRVALTSSPGTIIGAGGGAWGAAQFNSFTGPGSNTGFLFQSGFDDYLGGSSGDLVATASAQGNAVSQLIGTAMGLRNYGAANSQPTGIMQSPNVSLARRIWSAGLTHSGQPPVVNQDDTVAITSPANGITQRPDDHGDTMATATPLLAGTASGLISDRTADVDMFSYTGAQGNLSVRVSQDNFAGNFDAQLHVYGSGGSLISSSSPADSFDAAATFYMPDAGPFYIEVRGTGVAGGIGRYRLDAAFAPVTGPGLVTGAIVDDGTPQRSMVSSLSIAFSRPMSFPSGVGVAFSVNESVSGTSVPIAIDLSQSTPSQTIAVIRFPDGSGGFGSVPDGAYSLRVLSAFALDDDGAMLDGNADGLAGGDFALNFHRLFGDANGDHYTDNVDFLAFRLALGWSTGQANFNPAFDSNLDGHVDLNDFLQFRPRLGTQV